MTPDPQEHDDTLIDLGGGVSVDPETYAIHFAGKVYPGVRIDVPTEEDKTEESD
jgi:hypothetical protein